MDQGPGKGGGAPRDEAVVAIRSLMLVRRRPADAPGESEGEAPEPEPLEMPPEEVMRVELEGLRERHRDLDVAIEALAEKGTDPLAVRRLKKRKLMLRDRITYLEDQLTPDIIA